MQNQPLLLSSLLQFADRFHAGTEIVSRTIEGPIHCYTYGDASPSKPATAKEIFAFLNGKIAKWWMPDDVVFVEALTYGATGKVQKMELRRRFAGHYASQKSA